MNTNTLLNQAAAYRVKHGYPHEQYMLVHDIFNHVVLADVVKSLVPTVICEDGFVSPSEEGEAVADYCDAVVRGKSRLPKAVSYYFSDEVVAALHQAALNQQTELLAILAEVRTLKV